jgi:hypothetical protein
VFRYRHFLAECNARALGCDAAMEKYGADLRDRRATGGARAYRVFLLLFSDRGWGVEWILRLAAAGGEGPCVDIMEISKPDDLAEIA